MTLPVVHPILERCPECHAVIWKETPHICPLAPKPTTMNDLRDKLDEILDILKRK